MNSTKKPSRLKKKILSRYIPWIEAFGFVFIGLIIAIMIGSAIYKIDDTMKFTGAAVAPRSEPIELPAEAYIDSVEIKDGDAVAKDQALMWITTSPEDLALLKALASTEKALEALRAQKKDGDALSEVETSLAAALARGKATPRKEAPKTVAATVDGIATSDAKDPIQNLAGRIVGGKVGTVYAYNSLRFPVPVGGENALRVRVNLLAEEDVLSWKRLTAFIKSETPPDNLAVRRVWERLAGKLEEIKPGKTPLKRNMPEIVGAVNELLRARDFHEEKAWAGIAIPAEAKTLLDRGVATLTQDEVIRVNRLLLEAAMPQTIAPSHNEYQVVKAKLYIPVQHKTPDGKIVKDPPKIFPIQGTVVHEPSGGQVVIDLPNPPAEVVDYMKTRRTNPDLPAVTASGTVVVGRISLFRFLFR